MGLWKSRMSRVRCRSGLLVVECAVDLAVELCCLLRCAFVCRLERERESSRSFVELMSHLQMRPCGGEIWSQKISERVE